MAWGAQPATASGSAPDVPAGAPGRPPAAAAAARGALAGTGCGRPRRAVRRWPRFAWVAFRPQPETAAALAMQLGGAQSFTSDADYELAPRFSPDGGKSSMPRAGAAKPGWSSATWRERS